MANAPLDARGLDPPVHELGTGHEEAPMSDTAATAQVVIRPPLAWALAVMAAFALDWLMPLPFMPAAVPAGWLGGAVVVVALALFAWAIATITRAGSNVPYQHGPPYQSSTPGPTASRAIPSTSA